MIKYFAIHSLPRAVYQSPQFLSMKPEEKEIWAHMPEWARILHGLEKEDESGLFRSEIFKD